MPKKWTCNPSSPIFVYLCFIFEASFASLRSRRRLFFLQVARGEHARVREGLSFSPFACSRVLPSSKKKKLAPTTLAYAPLASSDVNVPCIILHFTVTVCQSQNSSKHLSN